MTADTEAAGDPRPDGARGAPPSAGEIAEYRATLESLMQRCLERVRNMDLPVDAEPLQQWNVDDRPIR